MEQSGEPAEQPGSTSSVGTVCWHTTHSVGSPPPELSSHRGAPLLQPSSGVGSELMGRLSTHGTQARLASSQTSPAKQSASCRHSTHTVVVTPAVSHAGNRAEQPVSGTAPEGLLSLTQATHSFGSRTSLQIGSPTLQPLSRVAPDCVFWQGTHVLVVVSHTLPLVQWPSARHCTQVAPPTAATLHAGKPAAQPSSGVGVAAGFESSHVTHVGMTPASLHSGGCPTSQPRSRVPPVALSMHGVHAFEVVLHTSPETEQSPVARQSTHWSSPGRTLHALMTAEQPWSTLPTVASVKHGTQVLVPRSQTSPVSVQSALARHSTQSFGVPVGDTSQAGNAVLQPSSVLPALVVLRHSTQLRGDNDTSQIGSAVVPQPASFVGNVALS